MSVDKSNSGFDALFSNKLMIIQLHFSISIFNIFEKFILYIKKGFLFIYLHHGHHHYQLFLTND